MIQRAATLLVCLFGARLLSGQLTAGPPIKPNILFILADDLGWMDVGFQGNRLIETPNLDRLAGQGMVFSQAYSYPLCTPSRAAIMTGKHPARLHMTRVFSDFDRGLADKPDGYHPALKQKPGGWDELSPAICPELPHSEVTLGELAREAGYRTGFFGKWHLGEAEHGPETQGFNTVFRGDEWSDYFAPYAGKRPPKQSVVSEHIADRLADEVIRFIKDQRSRPFLACAWFYDVHAPFQAKKELVDYYAAKLPTNAPIHPVYAAMVHTLDENAGRILQALDDEGLADNTLVILTSDNGGLTNASTGNMFDPREYLNRHPANSGKDLARCETSIGQTFPSSGEPFRLSFKLRGSGETARSSLLVEVLSDRAGAWSRLAQTNFWINASAKERSLSIDVEAATLPGTWLKLRFIKPEGMDRKRLRLEATEDDSFYGGTMLVDDQPVAGDLVLRVERLNQRQPRMVQLTANRPLRGQKMELYEGGIRVPLAIRWPGVVEAGTRCDLPVMAMDYFPSLAEVLGRKISPPLDGMSILPLLQQTAKPARATFYWHYPHYMFANGGSVIREGDYKLLEFYVDGRVELYNLANDVGEKNDLAKAMPNRVRRMQHKLKHWQQEIGAAMPARSRK